MRELEVSLHEAEARADEAARQAEQAAGKLDEAVALKNRLLREREEAVAWQQQQLVPPAWGSAPPSEEPPPGAPHGGGVFAQPPHLAMALFPGAGLPQPPLAPPFTNVRHHGLPPGSHGHGGGMLPPGALGQHAMPLWPPPPPPPPPHVAPGAAPLGMHLPTAMHGVPEMPIFGEFRADMLSAGGGNVLPPANGPPGFQDTLAPSLAASTLPAAATSVPPSPANDNMPHAIDERQLVEVFARAGMPRMPSRVLACTPLRADAQ